MFLTALLKNRVESLPAWVGRPLANVPFALRLGPEYLVAQRAVNRAERSTCVCAMADIRVYDERIGREVGLFDLAPAVSGGFVPHFGWSELRKAE